MHQVAAAGCHRTMSVAALRGSARMIELLDRTIGHSDWTPLRLPT